ncbi:hypothetical protein K7X08_022899 [Anisodus acutangulus]|uniref:TCP domain-containing protein n=1 Tax=Anisodus acutangulus TaxID=402998 RepID=A0A9Q1MC41_9SOLA|nr:hypothetical protein K7X08_022899 [Anisodus acutangulus]
MKRATGGEIIQVEGGHILRSTGQKYRYSKVYTSKGPRDRRVRLSAHTSIQFYDVQDRLGYDRPSKVVDWLIKKAKNDIDKLAELPPWNPNEDVANNLATSTDVDVGSSGNIEPQEPLSNFSYGLLFQRQLAENQSSSSSYMMPESVTETQSVVDTSKSFFPMNSGIPLTNFLSFPHDIVMSRDSIQDDDQDFDLSLHTNLHHDQNSNYSPNNPTLNFEETYDNNNARTADWIIPHQPFFSQGGTFSQIREPLQSNFSQLIHHAWEQRIIMASEGHQSSISNSHFNGDFQFPSRIHGEEVNGVVCIKPSSGYSSSHH